MSISVNKLKSKFRHVASSDGKKKKAKAAAAVALAATLATGAVALNDDKVDINSIQMPNAVVQDIDTMNEEYGADDDKKAQAEVVETSSVRETISKIISVPLYAIGAAIMKAWEVLASSVVVPILVIVMKWVIISAAIIGSLALCFKIAFPDVPLKKILNKKCIGFILIGTAVGSVVCEILPLFWEDAETYIYILHVILGFAVFMPVFVAVMKVFGKKGKIRGKSKQALEA